MRSWMTVQQVGQEGYDVKPCRGQRGLELQTVADALKRGNNLRIRSFAAHQIHIDTANRCAAIDH